MESIIRRIKTIKVHKVASNENEYTNELATSRELEEQNSSKPKLFAKLFLGAVDSNLCSQGIEDARKSRIFYHKFKNCEVGILIISFMSLFLAVIQAEEQYNHGGSSLNKRILWILFFFLIILIFLTLLRYSLHLQLQKVQLNASKKTSVLSLEVFKIMVFEILIYLPQPYPFIAGIPRIKLESYFYLYNYNDYKDIKYYVNEILSILMVFRVYIIVRVLLTYSKWISHRANRICKMYGCDPGNLFAVRCLMKKRPLTLPIILFFSSILVFGHLIRICERPFNRIENGDHNFGYYFNCFWWVVITMTTVGYGDYYPRSIPGRIVAGFTAIWGVFVVSLMIVSLYNLVGLSVQESQSMEVLEKLFLREYIQKLSSKIISFLGLRYAKQPKKKLSDNHQKYLHEIKNGTRKLREISENVNISEELHIKYINLSSKITAQIQSEKEQFEILIEIAIKYGIDISNYIETKEKFESELNKEEEE